MEFLDFMGEVEKDNSCSGFCTKKDMYYFSDLSSGTPDQACADAFKGQVLFNYVLIYGLCFLCIGISLLGGCCCHYGLCQRDKSAGQNEYGDVKLNQKESELVNIV